MKGIVFIIVIFMMNFLVADAQSVYESMGSCLLPAAGWKLDVAGNYAYIACDSSGLQIVDVSDPSNPFIAFSYSTPDRAYDICLAGNYAYIADFSSLQILSIADPLPPDFLGSYATDNVISMDVSGNYAYLGCGYYSPVFQIIDISDPSNPRYVSGLSFLGGVFGLYYSNGYVYVLSNVTEPYSNYLRAIDVSDPANPFIAGSVMIGGDVEIPGDIVVTGNYAYIANRSSGLQTAEVSNPESLRVVGTLDTPGDAWGVFAQGIFALVADYYSGLQIVGIRDPANPYSYGDGSTGSPAIAAVGWALDLVYVTTADSLVIFRHPGDKINEDSTAPREFSIDQNYPNPFNSSTVISYSLPVESFVTISIYNVMGQLETTIFEGIQQAGQRSIDWSADDYPSGIYFARVGAAGRTGKVRMLLVK